MTDNEDGEDSADADRRGIVKDNRTGTAGNNEDNEGGKTRGKTICQVEDNVARNTGVYTKACKRTIVIGFGNPAREDDGLGPAIAEEIEKLDLEGLAVDSDYQLTVTDAAIVAENDTVIFIDAAVSGEEPFSFYRLTPRKVDSFSSHSASPEAVLGLAKELFDWDNEAYMLSVRGYSFEMFKEKMTSRASANKKKAVRFLVSALQSGVFRPQKQPVLCKNDGDRK